MACFVSLECTRYEALRETATDYSVLSGFVEHFKHVLSGSRVYRPVALLFCKAVMFSVEST